LIYTRPSRPEGGNDNRPFGDYWALLALEKIMVAGGRLPASRLASLQQLADVMPPRTDRREILDCMLRRTRTSAGGHDAT
jgi:hypothetical protein